MEFSRCGKASQHPAAIFFSATELQAGPALATDRYRPFPIQYCSFQGDQAEAPSAPPPPHPRRLSSISSKAPSPPAIGGNRHNPHGPSLGTEGPVLSQKRIAITRNDETI